MQLYPLKFIPILKERIWGGSKLKNELGKPAQGPNIGESWEVSAVPGDISIVSNGAYEGISLQELIDRFPEELLGSSIVSRFGAEFPILIKFIDAADDLSIQVHPDDELARKRHNSFGKTEMWYVMQADPGARLLIDFNHAVSAEEYQRHLEDNTLLDLMNKEAVDAGDTFFINAGKIHAIGAGVMLAEIQQTSDLTYRVYDYDRRDANGNARELHTEEALEAIDFSAEQNFRVSYPKVPNTANPMVDSPYFTTNYIPLNGCLEQDLSGRDAFSIWIVVAGSVRLTTEGGSINLSKGETCLMPAGINSLQLEGENASLLEVTL
ncbi:type I phosphomannose isomerase catalytic subunit [Lentiprolixibacter aurantiacus]|uniref:Phosphohexomutase n=1 Tax=Lentiprolixibacter aurantiacus TaxID=2993939 RepID=A0AAE3SPG1_9FLAO|nr:type I phosphomannose isomerase catalytic subunit [Lentiprolixibacter aurantiacus]MCX2720181.1 mannose-6-phosphate isomerase [Lentiprolixibacter aurantiacus]